MSRSPWIPVVADLERRNVLVDVEEVGRVVPSLERRQPLELLRAVCMAFSLHTLFTEEVDVDTSRGVRLHGRPAISCPLDYAVAPPALPARGDIDQTVRV